MAQPIKYEQLLVTEPLSHLHKHVGSRCQRLAVCPGLGVAPASSLWPCYLIIRLFQLVFLVGIVFFLHNKSDGIVF